MPKHKTKAKKEEQKWPCPEKCKDIKLKTILHVMQECKITIEEYIADRKKYLEMCGITKEAKKDVC